jgi:LacI family transcriptional regulator
MPDAFFCHNDEAAMWCYKTLTDLGIRIPEDVGIVGCDGIPEGGYLPADLTSIVIPMQDVCSTAWTYLLARIADRNSAVQRTVVTPQLVVRASSLRV